MNLLLLDPGEISADRTVQLGGRRALHVRRVLGKSVGDTVRAGVLGGRIGVFEIVGEDAGVLRLSGALDHEPPPKLPVTLVLALPRPPVLRRVLQHVTAIGVPRIVLVHTHRVEKSYWQSPVLAPDAIDAQLRLGLEQAGDTQLPTVEIHRRLRPFAEDVLPDLAAGTTAVVAHPSAARPCPVDVEGPVTLVVGPEGGLVPFELQLFETAGLQLVTLGTRILRVETAVVALLARLSMS
jgi:RsmE family RNA methyltransferase